MVTEPVTPPARIPNRMKRLLRHIPTRERSLSSAWRPRCQKAWPRLENSKHTDMARSAARSGLKEQDSWDSWDSMSTATSPRRQLRAENGSDERLPETAPQVTTEPETSVDDDCFDLEVRRQDSGRRRCRVKHRAGAQQWRRRQVNDPGGQRGTVQTRRQTTLTQRPPERLPRSFQEKSHRKELLSTLSAISARGSGPQVRTCVLGCIIRKNSISLYEIIGPWPLWTRNIPVKKLWPKN